VTCAAQAQWYADADVSSARATNADGVSIADRDSTARERRFAELFDAHHDVIWRALRRLGVPLSHVDDATQRVFIVAARRLDEIREGEEIQFLYGVALKVQSELRRRDPARRFVADEDALASVADSAPGADEQLIAKEARAALDHVLSEMPDDLRRILVFVELEGQAVAVVAELLEIPAGTAASRLRRARETFSEGARRLRARLARGGA
jgi:RNA polymerase sigma-70 factor (ECF subfamily)